MKSITRSVRILSIVSLFTDMASEMLYPVMPIYLKSIGFSIILIGILEGFAESTAGMSKGYFGKLSDNSGRRVVFIQTGYALSAISKPMMAFFVWPLWIFLARTVDRFGKGIRTGARDAMLSEEATQETKGKVFGFHRSMDTVGAVLGPALALLYLSMYPNGYRTLFFIAFIPGLFAVIASFCLKDKKQSVFPKKEPALFFSFFQYWKVSPPAYRRVVVGLLAFSLFNSSDVFLLLKVKQSGLSDTGVIGVYIFYNLVYALFAFPAGHIADKIGLRKMYIIGISLFAMMYFGMSFDSGIYVYTALLFLYGLYGAATEGISKAWISNITDKRDTATAIGFYSGFQSISAMLASVFAGLIWYRFGPSATFITTAIVATLVIIYFLIMIPSPAAEKTLNS